MDLKDPNRRFSGTPEQLRQSPELVTPGYRPQIRCRRRVPTGGLTGTVRPEPGARGRPPVAMDPTLPGRVRERAGGGQEMRTGRPRRFAREDLLRVADLRAAGWSWRLIGRAIGTSGGRALNLFREFPWPEARDPFTWSRLNGDGVLLSVFQKCQPIGTDLTARAAGRPAGRPGATGASRTSVNSAMQSDTRAERPSLAVRERRIESGGRT